MGELVSSAGRLRLEHPTAFFALCAVALYLAFQLLQIAPTFVHLVRSTLGISSGEVVSPAWRRMLAVSGRKAVAFEWAAFSAWAATAAVFALLLRRPGVVARGVILAMGTAAYGGAVMSLETKRADQYRDLELFELEAPVSLRDVGDDIRGDSLRTFEDLYTRVRSRYEVEEPALAIAWRLSPGERLYGSFVVGMVSSFWAYGRTDPRDPGCVSDVRETLPNGPSLQDYLSSRVACCADFAALTSFLLGRAGIESRITELSGHQVVEARLDGRWYVLDANTAQMFEGTWSDLVGRGRGQVVRGVRLHHSNLDPALPGMYRAEVARMQMYELSWILQRSNFVIGYVDPPKSIRAALGRQQGELRADGRGTTSMR